ALLVIALVLARCLVTRGWRCLRGRRAFDDLVQFAAVEPHPTAGGAIIDLDPLPLAHDQFDIVDGALHRLSLPPFRCGVGRRQMAEVKSQGVWVGGVLPAWL